MDKHKAVEWSEIEQRVRSALSGAGIEVREVYKNVVPHEHGHGLNDHSYLCIHVPVNCRIQARNAIVAELGPDFATRYHTQAWPLNAVFIFAADRVWPDQVFTQRGPLPYEPGADRVPKSRRQRTAR